MQWSERLVAAHDGVFGGAGRGPRAVMIDGEKRVELRLERVGAGEHVLGELDRRKCSRANGGGKRRRLGEAQVDGHHSERRARSGHSRS